MSPTDQDQLVQPRQTFISNRPLNRPVGAQATCEEDPVLEESKDGGSSDQHASHSSPGLESGKEDAISAATTAQDTAPSQVTATKDPDRLISWPDDLLPLHKRILRLQSRYLSVQTEVNSERDSLRPKFDHLNRSILELVQLLQRGREQGHDDRISDIYRDAYVQLTADQQTFQSQLDIVDGLEQRLSNLEYELGKLQPELIRKVEALFKSDKPISDELYSEYYGKRGQVRILQYRLSNHLADFHNPVDDDEPPRDPATEDPGVQTGQFRDWWRDEYSTIWNELRLAEEQLTKLWNQCQEADLDVGQLHSELQLFHEPSWNTVGTDNPTMPVRESTAMPSQSLEHQNMLRGFLPSFNWVNPSGPIAPRMGEVLQFAAKQTFIKDWVGRMPSDPVEFENVFQSSRSEPERSYVDRRGDDVAFPPDYVVVAREELSAHNGVPSERRDSGALQKVARQLRGVQSDSELRLQFLSVPIASTLLSTFQRRSHDAS